MAIKLKVTKTKLDGTVEIETDQNFAMSKSVFFQRACRKIPIFSGPAGYRLKKDGVHEFKNEQGETIKIEVSEVVGEK